jgi:hypothetical protein
MAAHPLSDVSADDPDSATRPADAKEDLLMLAMRERAKGIKVYIRDGQESVAAQAVAEPLMRFNDIPRRFRDATLWYWKHRGRPVALLKTQVREKAPLTRWLDELNSLTDDLIEAEWADGHVFASRKPGLERKPLTDTPRASDVPRVRLQQMKEVARRFAVTITPNEGGKEELRLLAREIDHYSSADDDLLDGAMFVFTTNGTNPGAVLVIELNGKTPATATWNYGFAQMTTGGLSARLDDREVWSATEKPPVPTDYEEWCWFYAKFTDKE